MMTDNARAVKPPKTFVLATLPWIVGAVFLAIYGLTLNRWVSLYGLGLAAQVGGFDWQPPLTAPVLYLLTLPLRLLPVKLLPLALNLFSAICAALSLVLLTRSVALLPHDRTREQRMRESSEFSLLSLPTAWIPPVVAAAVLGLQFTFWLHSTNGSGEMLDVLLLAYVVRCFLEYRLTNNESWLARFCVVYGLAVTNNWAMIGLFPVALAALIGTLGLAFFEKRLLSKMFLAGAVGLLLYLLLPAVAMTYDTGGLSFWQALKYNLAQQKASLLFRGYRLPFLLMALASLAPLLLAGIRWPSSTGDVNPLANLFMRVFFPLLHIVFLAYALVVAWGPEWLTRQFQFVPLSFLSLYFLMALAIGYLAGYVLLVFSVEPESSWERTSVVREGINRLMTGAVWILLIAVPTLAIYKNWPRIKAANGTGLRDFVSLLAESLPPKDAVILCDDLRLLNLLAIWEGEPPKSSPNLLVNTAALTRPAYHRYLNRMRPDIWPKLPETLAGYPMPDPVPAPFLVDLMLSLTMRTPETLVYYAHPSFGYYFERLHANPEGLAWRMRPYTKDMVQPPNPTAARIRQQDAFWKRAEPFLAALEPARKLRDVTALNLAAWYSRSLNQWGVVLQRAGKIKEAGAVFARALQVNPDNVVAEVNLTYNNQLRAGRRESVPPSKELEARLLQYGSPSQLFNLHGTFDEPQFNMVAGRLFAQGGNYRQAIQNFLRAKELDPSLRQADLMTGAAFLVSGYPDRALRVVEQIHADRNEFWQGVTNQVEVARLEALCHFAQTNRQAAEAVLQRLLEKHYTNDFALSSVAYVYLSHGFYSNALAILSVQLKQKPDSAQALLNQAVCYMNLGQHNLAVESLNRYLALKPNDFAGLMNRAISLVQLGRLEEARKDYLKVISINADYYPAHYGLGEIAYRQNDKKKAIQHYQAYLKNAPEHLNERKTVQERLKQLQAG